MIIGVNLFIAEKSQGTIPPLNRTESQKSNPTDEKIKTALANLSVKESDHKEEKKRVNDGSKKRKECNSSQKMDKVRVRRLTLEKSEEKKENEKEPLIFTIANQEIQLPLSYKERLARDSDFFRGLFTHPMQEIVTGKYKLEDIELEEFQKLINLWSGVSTVSVQEAFDLLEVGHRLDLGESLVEILIPTIKNWSPTDADDIEAAHALSYAHFLETLPSLKSELGTFLVKAYLAASDHGVQKLLERIQSLDIRDVNLSESSVDDENIETLISFILINCPNLATLSLQRTEITDQSAVQIAKLSKLATLNVSECRFLTDAAMGPLATLPKLASLDVSYCWLTDAGLEQIAKFPNLTNLNLIGCEQLSGAGLRSISQLSKLSALNLSDWPRGGLEWIATQLPNLTSLQLSHCRLADKDIQWIAKLTHLTSLDISGCPQVTDAGIALIADNLTKLTDLNLAGCRYLTDAAAGHISRLSNLEGLSLKSCQLTDAGLERIAPLTKLTRLDVSGGGQLTPNSMQYMIKLTNLTVLGIGDCRELVTDKAMELISKLCHLRVLNVRNCVRLTNSGLKHIAELSHLTSLDISNCSSLTDDGYASIAKLLNLTHLDLQWNSKLTKASMQLVAEKCGQLTSLNIGGCDALGGDLIEIARILPNLTALNLCRSSSLTENGIVQIVEHLPKLTHLNISHCANVTHSAITQLAPFLRDLKSLNVSFCEHLTDEWMRELMVCRNLRELNITCCSKLTDASIEHMIQLPRLIRIQMGWFDSLKKSAIPKMRERAIRVIIP